MWRWVLARIYTSERTGRHSPKLEPLSSATHLPERRALGNGDVKGGEGLVSQR